MVETGHRSVATLRAEPVGPSEGGGVKSSWRPRAPNDSPPSLGCALGSPEMAAIFQECFCRARGQAAPEFSALKPTQTPRCLPPRRSCTWPLSRAFISLVIHHAISPELIVRLPMFFPKLVVEYLFLVPDFWYQISMERLSKFRYTCFFT